MKKMQKEDEKTTTQSSWNLSSRKITLIGNLMDGAVGESLGMIQRPEGFLQGFCDYYKAYQMWKQIASLIRNQLKFEEVKRLKIIERRIHKKCWKRNPEYDSLEGLAPRHIYPQALLKRHTPTYINYVNYLLRRHGMDISSRNLDLEEVY